ncbi:MAG: hypothetical protein Q6370_007495 [Candidatus Sigynarchaeota archaeon]
MVSTSGGKRPNSSDEKYDKVKRSLAEQDREKKQLMLVEAIVDLLVSNDIYHVKMMESIDYLREDFREFKVEITKQFDVMRGELDAIEAAIGVVSTRVDVVARHVQRVEDMITDMDTRLGKLEVKIANHDDRFTDVDKALHALDKKIDAKFDTLDKKIGAKFDEIAQLLRERK